MDDLPTDNDALERLRINRRDMIKKAALVGGTAWVAPIIVDSFASPAAAASCTTSSYQMALVASGGCFIVPGVTTLSITPGCNPAGFVAGTASSLPAGCRFSGTGSCTPNVVLTLNLPASPGCTCVISSAIAEVFNSSGKNAGCLAGVISNAGKTVVFTPTAPFGASWPAIRFVLCC